MDSRGEQVKPKEAKVENLAEKAMRRLTDVDRSLMAQDFNFPKGHEARGDTPFNSPEKALGAICRIVRQEYDVARFLIESGQKVLLTDTVSVSVVRAPSPREITYGQSLSFNDRRDSRTRIIELSYENSKGRSPGLIEYVSFSPDGREPNVSLADQDEAARGFDAMLKNHGDEATRKQLGGLSKHIVYEKFIAAMRVQSPRP